MIVRQYAARVRRAGRLRDLGRARRRPGRPRAARAARRGPAAVITDLGVLEPDPETLRARRSPHVHPGVDADAGARGDRLGPARSPTTCRCPSSRPRRSSTRCASSSDRGSPHERGATSSTRCARRSGAAAARSPACAPTTSRRTRCARCSRARPTSTRRGSTTSCSATPTARARTTATSRAWRCCSPGCRRACPATTVNRLCGSSLDAAMQASRAIETGDADARARRRRRVDEPRAVGAAQARAGLPAPATRRCTRPRSAGGWSTREMPEEWTISLGESTEKLAGHLRHLARGAGRVRAAQPPAARDAAWDAGFYDGLGRPGAAARSSSATRASAPTRRVEKLAKLQAGVRQGRHGHRRQRVAAQRRRGRGAARLARRAPRRPGASRWRGSPARGTFARRPRRVRHRARSRRPTARSSARASAGATSTSSSSTRRSRRSRSPAWASGRPRSRARQRQRRRDRDRPPARRVRRAHPRHARARAARAAAAAAGSRRSASASGRASRWCWRR